MSDFHELFDESAPDHDVIGDALRRELRDTAVPYDPQRADDMIAAATAADPRRLSRLAAPLATAAAVLAVGAGVAVFATTGGSDSAMPGGGGPKPTPTATSAIDPAWGTVQCASIGISHPRRVPRATTSFSPVTSSAPRRAPLGPRPRPPRNRQRPVAHTPLPEPEQTVTCSNGASAVPTPGPTPSCAAMGIARDRPLPRRLKSPPRCAVVRVRFAPGPNMPVPTRVSSNPAYLPPPASTLAPTAASRS